MTSLATFSAGVLSSLSADTVLHPLDNLKCQSQTGTLRFSDLLSLKRMYRGYFAVLLAGAPGNGVFFLAYESAQQNLTDRCGLQGSANYLLAGGFATVLSTSVYCPMEVVKETAIANRTSSGEAVAKVLAEQGASGFFRGWTAGVATWVPYLSMYYILYEKFREMRPALRSDAEMFVNDFGCGLVAGTVASSITYPIDTIKTRLQSGVVRRSAGWLVRDTLREVRNLNLYGLIFRVLWLAPNSALNVSLYERYSEYLGGRG